MRFVLLLWAVLAISPAFAQSGEEARARIPLENYLKGHATGDGAYMRKAFLPTAHVEGLREGKFASWSADHYVSLFGGKPSPEEHLRKRWIEKVEITGTAGVATIRFDYPSGYITDYFVLLQVDGEWKIANKVYAFTPKAAK
jgi:hypothetical protein